MLLKINTADFVDRTEPMIVTDGENTLKVTVGEAARRKNKRPSRRCRHLGQTAERDGVAVKVKCGCNGKEAEQLHVVYKCDVHKRCLPTLRITGEQLTKWNERKPESDIYHLCNGCEDFLPQTEATS